MSQLLETAGTSARENARDVAHAYDDYAFAQRASANDLLALTGAHPARNILEPGCGTGIYTELLLQTFPDASVEAVDIDPDMLHQAGEKIRSSAVRFRLADAEEPLDGAYDLITSNAAFQWFEHLERTLGRYAGILTENGILTFSFFGPGTYVELNDVLREVSGERVAARHFPDRDRLEAMLETNFPEWTLEETRYTHVFSSLRQLLLSIKYTGLWKTDRHHRQPWSPGLLARMEGTYRERYGSIRASYDVYLGKARK